MFLLPRYPTGQECQTYIEAYAEHAGLLPFIRFNVEVKSLTPKPLTNGTADAGVEGAAGWTVDWADSAGCVQGRGWRPCNQLVLCVA